MIHGFTDFYQHLLAGFYYKIGYCHYKLQRLDEAEKNYKQALDINKDLETDTKGKKRNANILNQLGRIKWTKGELNEAVLYYESSLKEKEELYGKYQPEGAITLMLLGLCLDDLGKLDDAIMHYEKCLEIYSSTPFRKEQYKKDIANTEHNMALSYQQKGAFQKALEHYTNSLKLEEELHEDKNHPAIATTINNMAACYEVQEDHKKALDMYNKALNKYHAFYGREAVNQDIAITLHCLGNILKEMEDFQEALNYLVKSVEMKKKVLGPKHLSVARTLSFIGDTFEGMSNVTRLSTIVEILKIVIQNFYL